VDATLEELNANIKEFNLYRQKMDDAYKEYLEECEKFLDEDLDEYRKSLDEDLEEYKKSLEKDIEKDIEEYKASLNEDLKKKEMDTLTHFRRQEFAMKTLPPCPLFGMDL